MTTHQVNSFFTEFLKKLKNESIAVWLLTGFLVFQMYLNGEQEKDRKFEFSEKIETEKARIAAQNKQTVVLEKILEVFENDAEDKEKVFDRILDNQKEILSLLKWDRVN